MQYYVNLVEIGYMEDVQGLKVSPKFAIDFRCRKYEGYQENVEEQKENLHDNVKQ